MEKNTIKKLQSSITEKVQRRLSLNNPNVDYDEDLIADYIQDALFEIEKWAKPKNDSVFLDGYYNTEIINFVIESINMNGSEGASSISDGSQSFKFRNSPLGNLKSRIPQGL